METVDMRVSQRDTGQKVTHTHTTRTVFKHILCQSRISTSIHKNNMYWVIRSRTPEDLWYQSNGSGSLQKQTNDNESMAHAGQITFSNILGVSLIPVGCFTVLRHCEQ